MRARIRGRDVIEWREEKAGPPAAPLASLGRRLSGTDARRVAELTRVGLVAVVAPAVRDTVAAHLGSEGHEQGGLLCGSLYRGARDAIDAVSIRAAVPATDFSSSGVSLRMETGVWDRARETLRPGEIVVGWYHSHPGLGAFFSGTDRRTQAAFFSHPFSLGWVIDPLRREEAWFSGAQSEPLPIERVVYLAA
jgi:proteasome lid subunit RPN8/RPN11